MAAHVDVRDRLAEVMAALAAGDGAAIRALYDEFREPLRVAVRRELRRRGVHDLRADDLDGLVLDACLVIAGVAGAWDPQGALPWRWASPRLGEVVDRWLGQFGDGRNAELAAALRCGREVPEAWSGEDPPLAAVLEVLGAARADLALVAEAFGLAGSPRDGALLLEYQAQRQAGDRSPAVTVARLFGMSEDAVRQVASRTRRRLSEVVAGDPRFAPLADTALLR